MSKNRSYWIYPVSLIFAAILPAVSAAADKVEVKGEGFGCLEPKQTIRILELTIEDKDMEAGVSLLDRNRKAGDCHVFEVGRSAFVEKRMGEDWVCLRPVGDPSCYWTHAAVIRGKER